MSTQLPCLRNCLCTSKALHLLISPACSTSLLPKNLILSETNCTYSQLPEFSTQFYSTGEADRLQYELDRLESEACQIVYG